MADEPSADKNDARQRKAAALRYDHDKDAVPRVVARGQGTTADRIIEVAKEHGVEVYEDPDLIELLCKLDVNEYVPQKLFVAVAEVLAYVYRVNNRLAEMQQSEKFKKGGPGGGNGAPGAKGPAGPKPAGKR